MLLGVLALLLQDLDALAAGLAAEDVETRVQAEKAVLELPGRLLSPMLEALGRRPEPEARALEDRIRVSASWRRIMPGSIRQVRARVDAIAGPPNEDRASASTLAFLCLKKLPPGDAAALLMPLLAEPAEPTRIFAMHALRVHPPADPAPLLAFLKDVRTSGLAAEVLVAMGARSAVPLAVDLFVEEGAGMLGAARVLEAFGAGPHAGRVAKAVGERAGLLVWGIRILRATGPEAEPLLLALAPEVSDPRRREIAEALAEIGTARSLPFLREIAAGLPAEERDALLRRFR
jgi:HEAT repeat protein